MLTNEYYIWQRSSDAADSLIEKGLSSTLHVFKSSLKLCILIKSTRYNFSFVREITAPLFEILEEVYKKARKHSHRAVSKKFLSDVRWEISYSDAFEATKSSLENAVRFPHPDSSKLFCLSTDASDQNLWWMLTNIRLDDLALNLSEQLHQPLAFFSGSFNGSILNWSTTKKAPVAIIPSIQRLD